MLTASDDKTIKIMEIRDKKIIDVLSSHKGPVTSISINIPTNTIVSGSRDKNVIVWKKKAKKAKSKREIKKGSVNEEELENDNESEDKFSVREFEKYEPDSQEPGLISGHDLKHNQLYEPFQTITNVHTNDILKVDFSVDGMSFVSADDEGLVVRMKWEEKD